MPAITIDTTDAVELTDLLRFLRDWIDLEEDQLDPLLAKHGYDLTGLRVDLDRLTCLLTGNVVEPVF
jgi:hypothetical protein